MAVEEAHGRGAGPWGDPDARLGAEPLDSVQDVAGIGGRADERDSVVRVEDVPDDAAEDSLALFHEQDSDGSQASIPGTGCADECRERRTGTAMGRRDRLGCRRG